MVGDDGYLDLVNRALGLEGEARIGAPSREGRIVKWVEEQARTLPPDVPEFDHYLPAAFLIERGAGITLVGEEAALRRFEKLFADLNSLLPK